ncbi:MAG TPA: bifunctional hydroxymethylpyrimidine kinase/phosphomethylpyrimidine kinase [Pyrinomonadaceae bacterium]|nr:bifunctional hydroxymethylpyrimidine kinase/phosphomethylpyrimidine kinase [Pyrinomonadaceae bacterium]
MNTSDSNTTPATRTPVALTLAGFDPSGGAGVVADIKTFTAFDCFAAAVITSLTFQNTVGVFGAAHQTAETVRAQALPVIEDFRVACAKTGMLPTREVIREVARLFRERELPAPVVDPVVRSTSGYDLIDDEALSALVSELLPLARIVTPNIPEAERMTGLRIEDEEGMRRAARALREMGARAVLVKGGHLKAWAEDGERAETAEVSKDSARTRTALDLLDDEGRVTLFRGEWIESVSTHGTGCTLSAAISACLGRGLALAQSVGVAKRFVADAIRQAPLIGHGHGPVNHNVKAVMSDE